LTDTDGCTPLHVAAQFGHLDVTKSLVEGGADFNYTDRDGYTPLMLAAYHSKLEIFRYLSEIGPE
jgi:ankyrin repeat protein